MSYDDRHDDRSVTTSYDKDPPDLYSLTRARHGARARKRHARLAQRTRLCAHPLCETFSISPTAFFHHCSLLRSLRE